MALVRYCRGMRRHPNANVSRGFTLIELLVVIAIIGVLASVLIASLSSSKNQGSDAALKEDMHSIQADAEI